MADPYGRGLWDAILMPKRSGHSQALFNGREIEIDVYYDFFRRAKQQQDGGHFSRDVSIWWSTLTFASGPQEGFLERIFKILRWGPLLYREKKSQAAFKPWPHPLAVALSHGGRILIQLPRGDQRQKEGEGAGEPLAQRVWRWLIGDAPCKERAAATHGIDELLGTPDEVCANPRSRKWLLEAGTLAGGGLQHWGVNIALGGEGQTSPFARLYAFDLQEEAQRQNLRSQADGRHGHVYLGYKRAVGRAHGGILIGVEGSEPGKWDVLGHFHGPSGTSSPISMAGGIKFKHLNRAHVPKQADCMFVDLASQGNWDRFRNHRNDEFTRSDLGIRLSEQRW
jgi:hypothetical protein